MTQVQEKYKDAEKSYGSELLNLVVAKGYLTKLVANEAVRSWLDRNTPEILEQFELVIHTTSMEEAVDQQAREVTDKPADANPAVPKDAASNGLAAE